MTVDGRAVRRVLRGSWRRIARPVAPPVRVLLVFVEAEPERYPGAFDAFRSLAREFRRGCATVVRVEQPRAGAGDAVAAPDAPRAGGFHRITGDASAWEFSGWHVGIRWACEAGVPFDRVLCANDAILNGAARGWGLAEMRVAFNAWSLAEMPRGMLGHVDASPHVCEMEGLACASWVRTNCFALDARTAREIEFAPLAPRDAAHDPLDRFAPRAWHGELLHADAPLSPGLRAGLTEWLTRRWHRAAPIDRATWPVVRGKLRAVLHERLLSARIRELGHSILEPGRPSRWVGACRPSVASDGRQTARSAGEAPCATGDPLSSAVRAGADPARTLACVD